MTRARRALGAAVIAVGIAGGPIAAQDTTHPKDMDLPDVNFVRPDPDNMRVEMANGLAAYIAVDRRAPLATLTAFVGVGSAHGAPGEAVVLGAALRRGPASLAPGAFRTELDAMAAVYTVTVGREETEVTLDVPAEDVWRAMELLAATLSGPAFGRDGSTAAGGAGRTSQMAGIDYASSLAGAVTLFESALFESHPYGRVASAAQMEAARSGGAQRLHRSHLVPRNTVLAIAGDFQIIEASIRAKEAFEDWRGGARPARVDVPPVVTTTPRQVVLGDAAKLQGWIVIGHELPVVPEEDEAALQVMDYVLGAYHLDSRLFRESREKRGLTNDNSSFLEPGVHGPGTYTMRTYGRPGAVRLLVDVTFRELETIRTSRPTDDELFVARGALVDGLWTTRYTTGLAATRNYALEWLRHGDHERSESYPERIRAVTGTQVMEAARRYLHPDRMIVAVVGPLAEIEAAPAIESEGGLGAWGTVRRVGSGR